MSEIEIIHDPRSAMLLPSNDPRRIALQEAVAKQLAERDAAEAARIAACKAEPPRSPAECRAALAQVIAAQTEAEQALAKARAAQSQATLNEKTARERLAACEAAAAKAKAEHITRCEQAARAGKPLPTSSRLRAANSEVADASEAVEAARTAGARISEQLPGLERELRRAQDRVAVAVDDRLRAESVLDFVAETRELMNKLVSNLSALDYRLTEKLVAESERQPVTDLLNDAESVFSDGRRPGARRVRRWRATLTSSCRFDSSGARPGIGRASWKPCRLLSDGTGRPARRWRLHGETPGMLAMRNLLSRRGGRRTSPPVSIPGVEAPLFQEGDFSCRRSPSPTPSSSKSG